MNYCKACGKTVHETAANCPHCGAVQYTIKPAALSTHSQGPIWTSITGLTCGLFPIMAAMSEKDWSKEEAGGAVLFATIASVLGGLSIAKHHRGRGMAIAALVLGVIGFLLAVGSQT